MTSSKNYNTIFITYVEEIFLNRIDTKGFETNETGVHPSIIFIYLLFILINKQIKKQICREYKNTRDVHDENNMIYLFLNNFH